VEVGLVLVLLVLLWAGAKKQNSEKQLVARRRRIKISFRKDSRQSIPPH
jgi:hypothetical protein